MNTKLKLHNFYRSSTSFRARIALAIKGLEYEYVPVNLGTSEQRQADYLHLNPSGGVPVLIDGEVVLSQSLAIIDYLDAQYPMPRLIPEDPLERARVLELSQGVACDIHPINNRRVLLFLHDQWGLSEEQTTVWYQHWTAEGLAVTEKQLARHGHGPYCFGQRPTLADCCLVPQVFNAQINQCEIGKFERVMAVYNHCKDQPEFKAAWPMHQPDCPPELRVTAG